MPRSRPNRRPTSAPARPRAAVVLALLALACARPEPADAQAAREPGRRLPTSAEIIARRQAAAEAREQRRRAWLEGRSSAGIADGSPSADDVGAIEEDLRAIGRERGWTGRMTDEWIGRVAPLIASESARYDLPPALVMGVIQLESGYDPVARSWAGATRLMQVMPAWLGELDERFGTDLTDEATNLRYGTWVLQNALAESGGDLREALLRYNGCRPESTRGCTLYPDRVRQLVETHTRLTCRGQRWDVCVAEPVRRRYSAPEGSPRG